MTELLAIGTKKGLFLAVALDNRGPAPRVLAGADNSHFGPSVSVSDDLGATWQEPDAARWPSRPTPAPPSSGSGSSRRPPTAAAPMSWSAPLWDHPHRPEWGAGG